MIKKSFYLFLFILLLNFTACKTKYDLRDEKDASQQIVEDIQNKKLIFLGDEHDWCFPTQFLANNLEIFYKAGIRYIFLEEKCGYYLKKPEQYDSFVYPAWGTWGFKQEYHVLTDEITKVNEKYKTDPLIVVWPEENAVFTEEDKDDTHIILNKRDSTAQKVIIDVMDNTEKKGLIFYGSAHGLKKPTIWDSNSKEPYWTMMGVTLSQYFDNDFCTYRFIPYYSYGNNKVIYDKNGDCKAISEENLNNYSINNYKWKYNYYCLCPNYVFAVPEFYIPEERNIKYMFSLFKDTKIADDKKIDVWSKKSEQLLAIYYLKYHLGDKFDFDWTKSEEDLYDSLKKVKEEDFQNLSYDLKKMENYLSFLHSEITDYILNYPKCLDFIEEDLRFYLSDMEHAQKINPFDIWPQYWIAYLKTDKALVTDKKKDYKTALQSWEELFKNNLFYASPIIKLAYEKASLCAEKTLEIEKKNFYYKKAQNVNFLLDIDFESYEYFGR